MFRNFGKEFLFVAMCLLFAIGPSAVLQGKPRPTTWHVYPSMDRELIQSVVNNALNGDTVYFHAGTYDWSGAPIYPRYANEGAINIIDKTLTIKGEPGNLIMGPDSPTNDAGVMYGIHAFHVLDLDTTHDVVFMGLNIQHFMRGIVIWHNVGALPEIPEYTVPNARNITIKNCTISDTARQGIGIMDATGSILIQNNTVATQKGTGIWLTYLGPDSTNWQPDNSTVKISENNITSSPSLGIYVSRTKNCRVENNSVSMESPSIGLWGIGIEASRKGTIIFANSVANYRRGISVRGWSSPSNDNGAENLIIDKNKVICMSPNWCYGIIDDLDLSSGHLITRNEINLTSTDGVGIYTEGNHNYYEQNRISGTGWTAVCLYSWDYTGGTGMPTYPHHDTFLANDVSKFTASEAHYYLDYGTHDNQVFGFGKSPWTYKDFGVNNLIIGGTNITSTALQALGILSPEGKKPHNVFREGRENILF
jgi:parallel beta-helix repeat protein